MNTFLLLLLLLKVAMANGHEHVLEHEGIEAGDGADAHEAQDESAHDPPEQYSVLVDGRDRKEAEQHRDHEDVVHSE